MAEIIGFIGTGNMGSRMVGRLLKGGYQVIIFDAKETNYATLKEDGAKIAKDLGQLAKASSFLVTMLPSGEELRSVYEELSPHLQKGTLLMDCSTVDVATARSMSEKMGKLGIHVLDAPVSGGVAGAAAGNLTFMVGGASEDLAKARPTLEKMGKRIVHCGDHGTGQAAKICNNMILGASMIAVSEAFVLARHLGLPADKLFEVSSQSSGQCWALTQYCPAPGLVPSSPANNQYRPGFASAMMLKDLQLSMKASDQALPLTERAAQLYEDFVHNGGGALDFSAIIDYIEQL